MNGIDLDLLNTFYQWIGNDRQRPIYVARKHRC